MGMTGMREGFRSPKPRKAPLYAGEPYVVMRRLYRDLTTGATTPGIGENPRGHISVILDATEAAGPGVPIDLAEARVRAHCAEARAAFDQWHDYNVARFRPDARDELRRPFDDEYISGVRYLNDCLAAVQEMRPIPAPPEPPPPPATVATNFTANARRPG